MGNKKQKIRTTFRKNRTVRTRPHDITRSYDGPVDDEDTAPRGERVSGKGDLVRKRTVVATEESSAGAHASVVPYIDAEQCRQGRVLCVQGLLSTVEADDGTYFKCATRRLLKTLATEQRHVVAAGDRVWFRPEGETEGVIERVEPRRGVLSRTSRGRQQIMVANVDQLAIVASAAEPQLKPHLVDRFLASAEKNRIRPLVCVNKIDLVDPAHLQPWIGVLSQLGYRVLLLSAKTGRGIDRLRRCLAGQQTVIAGQSGVGKSSLLNAAYDELELVVQAVSGDTSKGRHTTSTAELIPLPNGGYVVDTPGIRQFELWDVVASEVAGLFRDIRPYVSHCRFPDCTHTHEVECAVKDAVADARIDTRRYESYVHLVQ